jgi:large subunit ribosomal protein L9
MELILLEDVLNLGGIGDLVKVKPGYGRNFLLPRKLAVVASTKSKARLEHEKRLASFRLMKAKEASEALAKQMKGTVVSIARKVGENDKLFGSVTSHDIAQALIDKGVKVDRRKVLLAEPIKQLGDFAVKVRLRTDVVAEIKVQVVAEASA